MIYRILGHCVLRGRRKEIGTLQKVAKTSFFYALQSEVAFLSFGFFEILKMILRGRHSTSDDSASIFRGKRSTFNTSDGKIAKSNGMELQVVQPASPKWRKPRKVSLSALQLSFLEEVSHNCCMFVSSTPIFWQVPCRLAICSSVRQVGGSDRSVRYKGKYNVRSKR